MQGQAAEKALRIKSFPTTVRVIEWQRAGLNSIAYRLAHFRFSRWQVIGLLAPIFYFV